MIARRYGTLPSVVLGISGEIAPRTEYRLNNRIAMVGIEEEIRREKLAKQKRKLRANGR